MDFYLLKTIILGVFIGNLLVYIVSIAVNKIRETAHKQQMKRELVTLRKMLQECDEKEEKAEKNVDNDIFK